MFQLLLIKNDGSKTYDITPIVDTITWDYNLSLTAAMSFNILWTDAGVFPANPCDLGDVVTLSKDGQEVYRGIIISENRNGRSPIGYNAYDYAWYLGKSKSVYQFNGISASDAILRVLNDFGMLIGNVPAMSTKVEAIYIQKTPAEIIEEVLKLHEQASGDRYVVDMEKGRIYIKEMRDMIITGTFQLADNLTRNNVLDNPLEAQRTRSIEALRNRIKIMIERDDKDVDKTHPKYEVVAAKEDAALIKKYGLLEETYKIDVGDVAKARKVAQILFARTSRVQETNTIKLMGDVAFKAGRLLKVNEPITKMSGTFMIVAVKHAVTNQIHTMDVELAWPEDVRDIIGGTS